MFRYALRLTTIFILIQALLLFPLAASRTQDKPTPFETVQAHEIAALFMKRMEETGDLSRVIDELFVEDFIQRYIQEQQGGPEEANPAATLCFVPGLNYKRDLLTQATTQDWRRFYVATHNVFYHVMLVGLNQFANDLLNDREPDEGALENLLPPNVMALFDAHPILKNFFESQGESKDIETVEEMRSVTETLEEGLRLMQAAQGNTAVKPTEESKQVFEKFKQTESGEPTLEISEKEFFGYPAGTRMLWVMTPIFFGIVSVEVNGTQKIVWAELTPGD